MAALVTRPATHPTVADFNARGESYLIGALDRKGWKQERHHGENVHLTRPGKRSGTSATWSRTHQTLHAFTDSVPGLPSHESFGPFNAFKYAIHGGDFRAACAELEGAGFGKGGSVSPPPITEEEKRRRQKYADDQKRKAEAKERAKRFRETVRSEYAWSLSPIDGNEADHWRLFLKTLFADSATVWIAAQVTDSGYPRHKRNFRTVAEWLREPQVPGTYIAQSTFRPGTHSRGNEFVSRHCYVVVEVDKWLGRDPETPEEIEENRAAGLAVARWVQEGCNWNLRAVIDSGNKSYHAWFHHPGEERAADLANVAHSLGVDPALTRPAQPFRLPGVPHHKSGNLSKLVYLAS